MPGDAGAQYVGVGRVAFDTLQADGKLEIFAVAGLSIPEMKTIVGITKEIEMTIVFEDSVHFD